MGNDLRIAVRDQAVTARFQLCAFLRIVEKLSVKDDRDASIFIGHRLLAIRQSDDTKPARPKDDARPRKYPSSSGPRWMIACGHPLDDAVAIGRFPARSHDARDATHDG